MKKLIITTVGTSALDRCSDYTAEKFIEKYQNEKDDFYNRVKVDASQTLQGQVDMYLKNNKDIRFRKCLSAEIASLLVMEDEIEDFSINSEDKIALLFSHTIDGKICAEINSCGIQKKWNIKPEMHEIEGLDPANAVKFVEMGLNNLFEKTKKLLEENSDRQRFINITGGYKGLIPIQTLQAEMNEVPIVYLFEESELAIMKFADNGIKFWIKGQEIRLPFLEYGRRRHEQ